MSDGIFGQGTTLSRDGHLIAELTNVGSLDIKVGKVDMTHHQSPGKYKESKPGLREVSDLSIEGNFILGDTDGQLGLYSDLNTGAVREFVITAPDGAFTWTFQGWVAGFTTDEPIDNKISFKATISVTGQPILAIGTSNDLSNLVASAGSLIPAFDGDVYDYVLSVPTGTSSVALTPTAAMGEIKVDGNVVASGVPSSAIQLGAAGSVKDITVTVEEEGKIRKSYAIKVARASA